MLAFVMVITLLPDTQLVVQAKKPGGNGTDHNANSSTSTNCHGGPTYMRQGYRVYIIDSHKKVISDFPCNDGKGGQTRAQVRDLYAYNNETTTTVGKGLRVGSGEIAPGRMKIIPGMPVAFAGNNWVVQGKELHDWMYKTNTRTYTTYKTITDANGKEKKVSIIKHEKMLNMYYLILQTMGYKMYKLVRNDDKTVDYDWTIVVEPIAYHVVFKSNGKSTGKSYFGTGNNWLRKYDAMGIKKSNTTQCESYVLQCALTLQKAQYSLTKPTYKVGGRKIAKNNPLTLDARGSQGYAVHFYYNKNKPKSDKTHTFDYQYNSKFRPEKAPKEKKSEGITIVKTYRVKKINKDGDIKYIDKGTYVRKETLKEIDIENEPTSNVQYHVIGYQTTDKVKKDIDALKWKSIMEDKEQVGNVTKHATVKPNNNAVVTTVTLHKKIEKQRDPKTHKKKTIKQKHDETVLYVLLQKEEKEKPISGDYTLKQSQISKRVDLYKTEKDKNILKGHSFVWDSSALNDACSGHTYYHSSENCTGHTYYCSWSLDDTSLSLAIMNARYRADEYKYNIAYKAWDDEWEDKEVANQC